MTTRVVFIIKFIMVVASWEVVGIKQITSIETSVAARVPDHTKLQKHLQQAASTTWARDHKFSQFPAYNSSTDGSCT